MAKRCVISAHVLACGWVVCVCVTNQDQRGARKDQQGGRAQTQRESQRKDCVNFFFALCVLLPPPPGSERAKKRKGGREREFISVRVALAYECEHRRLCVGMGVRLSV